MSRRSRPAWAHVTPWAVTLLAVVVAATLLRAPVLRVAETMTATRPTDDGGGRVVALRVHGAASHTTAVVRAWLPPQYDDPRYAHHRFPVLVWLPGQPGTPQGTYRNWSFGHAAGQLVRSGRVQPFVAVFPPLMVRPPRDTECTDVPGGPQALSWLGRDVPDAIRRDLRVTAPGRQWSVLGFSTGGFCAAKLLLREPGVVGSAVSVGGYYRPLEDHTTGDLFGHDAGRSRRIDLNSPEWLLTEGPAAGVDTGSGTLLAVASTHDRDSWAATREFLARTRGSSRVQALVLAGGGHHAATYEPVLPRMLGWLADHAGWGRVAPSPAYRHAGVLTRGGSIRDQHPHA